MKRDDKMLLVLTFLTGMAIGMYVYIAFFKPTYIPQNINNTEEEAQEWSVVARRYGGDLPPGFSNATFRLIGNGEYTYLPASPPDSAMETRSGKISGSLMRALKSHDSSLNRYTANVTDNNCVSNVDGFDYEYSFTKDGEVYKLDTCRTALRDDTPLAELLADVWNEVEGRQVTNRPDSFSDWAKQWIRTNLGVDQDSEAQ